METNIGTIDQLIRIAVLMIAAVLYFVLNASGFTGTILGIIVIYSFMTALTRYSPVWELYGISTKQKVQKKLT